MYTNNNKHYNNIDYFKYLPGTTIWSDMWAAYNRVTNVAGHSTVNHSVEFIDRQTGVHTNHIESYWNRVKIKFERMKGCHQSHLPGYLDEFMWRERYGREIWKKLYSCMMSRG